MSARLLNPRSSLLTLILELRYTLSRCQADPRAAFCVPDFQVCRDECSVVQKQELDFLESLSDAQASVDIADENIDDFASRLSKAILTVTRDDRSHPVYGHFFGKKPISTFLRPKLGVQLDSMRSWGESLTTSQFPALPAMAAELSELVAAADKALAARFETQSQIRTFRDVGAGGSSSTRSMLHARRRPGIWRRSPSRLQGSRVTTATASFARYPSRRMSMSRPSTR